jgi:hypothetical protein
VDLQTQGLGFLAEWNLIEAVGACHAGIGRSGIHRREFDAKVPDPAQETIAAFHRRIVPLQRGFGRGGEHGV